MLHHQDPNLSYGGASNGSSSNFQSSKCDKDRNFNFLPGRDDDGSAGDENRNQVRPRNLTLGREPQNQPPPPLLPSSYQTNAGLKSPRSRMPCWRTLEPLPEIESGDDGYGRVPPEGAEEGKMEEGEGWEASRGGGDKQHHGRKGSSRRRDKEEEEMDDEWGDSECESEASCRSGCSASSLNMESGGEAPPAGGVDRIGVGEPKPSPTGEAAPDDPGSLKGALRLLDEQSSDSDGELLDVVWTLRDRERFKAQEMEKHQAQLTMYRRLALIRWVRTLQGRVQEQQDRLQSSFDVILTHRKELLRMGAAVAVASPAPAAAVGQS